MSKRQPASAVTLKLSVVLPKPPQAKSFVTPRSVFQQMPPQGLTSSARLACRCAGVAPAARMSPQKSWKS